MKVLRSATHWGAMRLFVEDGRITRVEPFEHDPAPSPLIHAFPEMVYSDVRVAQPSVRKGWLKGDKGAGRGEDEFVEMPWDEALNLAAREIDRVRKDHGNSAIFGGSYGWASAGRVHHARTLLHRFLNTIGGFTGQVTNYSYGAAMAFLPRVLGASENITAPMTTLSDVAEHAEVVVAFGGLPSKNWQIQSGGAGLHTLQDQLAQFRRKGVRFISVSPYKGDGPEGLPFDWIPIRPNTDAALMFALIHEIVRRGAQDRDFLDRYTIGFNRLWAYISGQSDGVAKDAVWAATITGLPSQTIGDLATSLIGHRSMLTATWSLQRARHGEQPFWALIALACVLGRIGLPGQGFAFGYGSMGAIGDPGYRTPLYGLSVGTNPVGISIPVARVADLLLDPGASITFDGRTVTYPDIRLVYWAGGNPFHHHQDLNRLRRAFRKPETIIVNEQYWNATARHADIVFPATTSVERNDIGGSSRDPYLLAMHKAIEPVGGARDDYDIFRDLAQRLGTEDAFTGGRTTDEWVRDCWERTRAKLADRGVHAPDFDTLFEEGYFRVPEPEKTHTQFRGFREDPARNRLATPSGRIELFSQTVADRADPEQPGHPVWCDPEEWLGAPLAQQYPLHLLTPQPAHRLHGQMEQSSVSKAAKRNGYEILRMNVADAKARGIAQGDLVRIFNARGACVASADVSEDVAPGVVLLPTGADFQPDAEGNERHSNPNVLTRDIGTSSLGQGCAAQSCLVEVSPGVARKQAEPRNPSPFNYTR